MILGMTRKIGISVDDALLGEVDRESETSGTSRSAVFAEAARTYLANKHQREAVDRYVNSYIEHPESDEEVAATDAFTQRSFDSDGS